MGSNLVLVLPAAAVLLYGSQAATPPPEANEESKKIAQVKRICVERLAGDEKTVEVAREMAIAGLFSVKRFVVLEKCDKAEATLKGAVMERFSRRSRGEGESTDFGVAAGGASVAGSTARAGFGAATGGASESLYSSETSSSASVILRLVHADGGVIWATTQDSNGGKLKGAVPDAIDRAIKQLMRDVDKASKNQAP
ncbi:MAG: hypothetical protein JST93_28870 [Acidobacteria bacterium]|nr:hypothetical protein [Acidobacteriota bacterium]